MFVLDTCVLIFDALTPNRLTESARATLDSALSGDLSCCDISLWEIAMLIKRGRLDPATDTQSFIELVLSARGLGVLPITPSIATLSASLNLHGDPADRLIAATTLSTGATLLTADRALRRAKTVPTLW